jgi:hypothetical protein
MTKWEEHLLYRSDRKADRRDAPARISTLAADGPIGRRKSLTLRGLSAGVTGFRQVMSRRVASSGRKHFPLLVGAPLAEFAAVASQYHAYRIELPAR